jgi:amino acid adenylation domain-containing protein
VSKITKTGVEDIYPLSPLQQGLFFQHLLGPAKRSYWNQLRLYLKGDLDVPAFRAAWQNAVNRHTVLRTRFVSDRKGRTFQVVNREASVPWHYEDLADLGEAECEARIAEYEGGEAQPLDQPPLMSVAVFKFGAGEHVVAWAYQHIILDGWSERIVWDDVWTAYRHIVSGEDRHQAPPAPYSAYIGWLQGRDKNAAKKFWAGYLAGFNPARTSKEPSDSEDDYAEYSFNLSASLSERASESARLHRLTLTTVLQGCWALVLAANRDVADIVIGSAINDRPADLAGSETIAGLMMASVPMRYRTDSTEPVVDWLHDSQAFASAMSAHSGLTLGEIKSAARISAAEALFDTLCALNSEMSKDPLAGKRRSVDVVQVEHRGLTEFPLSVTFLPSDVIELNFTVDTTIYDTEWCERARDDFAAVLEQVCSAPQMPVADIARSASETVRKRDGTGTPGTAGDKLSERSARHRVKSGNLQGVDYWCSRLEGTLPALEFPMFRPRPPERDDARESVRIRLDEDLVTSLGQLAHRKAVVRQDIILAGIAATLLRYCRQGEVIVGTLRNTGSRATPGDTGTAPRVNCIALRLQPSKNGSFSQFVDLVAETTREAEEHVDTMFEDVVAALPAPLDSSRAPVFQVLVADCRYEDADRMLEFLETSIMRTDLSCWISESESSINIELEYASTLFETDLVRRFASHFRSYLTTAAADADRDWLRIPLLNANDEAELLTRQGIRVTSILEKTVLDLVGDLVTKHATRTAVSAATGEISYGELHQRYSMIARNLVARGVKTGAIVGLAVSRTERLPLAMLAILEARAAFLPLDVGQPVDRLKYVLENSGAQLIVTDTMIESSLQGFEGQILHLDELEMSSEEAVETPDTVHECSLAYVMYTSGSTGMPKGVAVGHRELTNLLTAFQKPLAISCSDVWAAITTTSFDISVMELLLPLTVGARVHVVGEAAVTDGRMLAGELVESGATIMQGTPASWRLLFDSGWSGDPTLTVLCGGEPLPLDLAQRLDKSCGVVWNVYGPTETTIWSTMAQVGSNPQLISIGTPIRNTSIYVVDEYDALVPDGVEGEILIAGEGVARGYLNNPELTTSRFGVDPFNDRQRVYRTGDVGRWLPNGELEHRGRSDSQLKLRGFRIEAGDVENNLATADGVNQVAVTIRPGPGGDPRLVAFVVLDDSAHFDAIGLRRHLRNQVPDYMIPQHFIELNELPLTHNRKVDYANLPQLDNQVASSRQHTLPTSASEKLLADVWCDLIGLTEVSTNQNFFEVGGHSMLTIRAIAIILRETGVELQPQVFIHEDFASIARRIEGGIDDGDTVSTPPARTKPTRKFLRKLFGPGN